MGRAAKKNRGTSPVVVFRGIPTQIFATTSIKIKLGTTIHTVIEVMILFYYGFLQIQAIPFFAG